MESKLVYVINAFLDTIDDDDDKRSNLEELAEDPCEWVLANIDTEIYDMNTRLGLAIWRYGFDNIDFDYLKDIYIIKLKLHDENANAANEDANEDANERADSEDEQ